MGVATKAEPSEKKSSNNKGKREGERVGEWGRQRESWTWASIEAPMSWREK